VARKRLREPPLRRLRALDVGIRDESNLSRTLTKPRDTGIVEFEKRGGRSRDAPRLIARRVTLELDLVGSGSVISVERPEAG
jgi:predicted transcriptional regulator